MKWDWEHKPRRVPDLDRSDLETICLLVREYGNKNIPIFSARLMKKIEESMIAYRMEDELLQRARDRMEKPKIKTWITWPPGTEKYSNGPFFD